MEEIMAMLRNEQSFPLEKAAKFMMPKFDPSINYIQKVGEQSDVLEKVQSLYEDHSNDYLKML